MPFKQPTHLRPGHVAELFNVSTSTLGRWAAQGKIRTIQTLGGHRRYLKEDVDRLLGPTPFQQAAQKILTRIHHPQPQPSSQPLTSTLDPITEDYKHDFDPSSVTPQVCRLCGHTQDHWMHTHAKS